MEVVRVMWPISACWGPNHILAADETRHFKFGMQIDRNEHNHMHVQIPWFGGDLWSCDLQNFGGNKCLYLRNDNIVTTEG